MSNLIDTFHIGPLQQPQNFYILNNANNNFVFECTFLDVSAQLTVLPSFVEYTSVTGFTNSSETATLNVSSELLNGLFIFQPKDGNSLDISNLNQMLFGVKNASFNFNYSSANVSKNNTRIPLYKDYINSLAQTITGGPYDINQKIFSNASQLRAGIAALDANFNTTFNLDIQHHRDPGLNASNPTLTSESYNASNLMYSTSCQQLIYGLITLATENRINTFFEDINIQDTNMSNMSTKLPYNVIFHPGDNFAIKIIYTPSIRLKNLESSNIVFSDRSYKIFLQVV